MEWIRKHKLLSTILITLLILVVIFVVSIVKTDKGNVLTDGVTSAASPISGVFTSAYKAIRTNVLGIFSYKELQKEVESLKAENQNLTKKLTEAKLQRNELEELEELSNALNFEYTKKSYKLISGDLITMDGSNWTNVFTINLGASDGVEVGDAVVNGMGLVGRIEDIGKHWSKVVAIVDEGSKVSFRLYRDRKQLGVAKGNEKADVEGFMMNAESTVVEGDVIVTSGLGNYPAGLEIGNVKSVTYNSNTMLKEITVETAVNFKEIDKVAVIK